MPYRFTYNEIWELVRREVIQTKTARKIMRKSGFRPGASSSSASGAGPILTLPPVAFPAGPGGEPPPAGVLIKHVSQQPTNGSIEMQSVAATAQNGDVWVWGNQTHGQFGLGHTSTVGWTVVPDLPPIEKTCYAPGILFCITEDGDVYAAGRNNFSQIAPGTADQLGFVEVVVPGLVVQMDATQGANVDGTYHALTDSGLLYSWGSGALGQLGDGYTGTTGNYVSSPTLNTNAGTSVEQVACGNFSTLFRTTAGNVYGFGYVGIGEVNAWWGDVTPEYYQPAAVATYVPVPVQLPLGRTDIVDLSCGGADGLLIYADGTAEIMSNVGRFYEQATPPLADWSSTSFYYPVLGITTAVNGWTRDNGGGFAIRLADGSLYAFGENDKHDVGDGTDTPTYTSALYRMYKGGAVLGAADPISFSGKTTYFSTVGDYYVALEDGTLLKWHDSSPAAINDDLA